MFKNLFQRKFLLSAIAGILFFSIAFLTLPHYGISWDEPTHFKRGQGYLWFYLTGNNDYRGLPAYNLTEAQTNPRYHERSIYQDDKHNSAFYRTIEGGHPPLSDILASLTNVIFYQRLGLLGDIESYHLYEIFISSIGVAVLSLFVYEGFGVLAAMFSTIFFATYPLFWAESHFNIKDPIETTWIVITLYFLWKAVQAKAVKFIFLSSIFAGFALGTKFNIVFLPFIILPWFIFIFIKQKQELLGFVRSRNFILSIIFYPIISFLIFYISYPFLWENPLVNIGKVLTYYEKNALDPAFANATLPNWPFYALRWVILTAPPLVLLGLIASAFHLKNVLLKHSGFIASATNSFILLVILWFVVTLARVSIPGVNIYGGVRQIMEYIPAVSILAGIGFGNVVKRLNKITVIIFIIIIMVIQVVPLFKLHPNENVYFNFLSGGLRGAVEAGVPAAGNSFGNAYYQGVAWINQNAIRGAKLTLIQGSAVNIPRYKVRSDIDLSNDYFSGIGRGGEYLMALTYNLEHKENFYAWEYVDKFLIPVYEVKADGISILKIWKNDLEHTRQEYKLSEILFEELPILSEGIDKVELDIGREVLLLRIGFSYDLTDECFTEDSSTVETSPDGKVWFVEKDPLTFLQVGRKENTFRPAWESIAVENKSAKTNTIVFYLAGRKAKFVRFVLANKNSCAIIPNVKILYLDKIN